MDTKPFYIDLAQARTVLAEIGIEITERQMKRAAEADAQGRRKLPFFIDPIEGTLKIERQKLVSIYTERQVAAERNRRPAPSKIFLRCDSRRALC